MLSKLAADLPTLPFTVLKTLFDATPLTTDDGLVLRHKALDSGVIHLLLGCLSVLSHHAPRAELPGVQHEVILLLLCDVLHEVVLLLLCDVLNEVVLLLLCDVLNESYYYYVMYCMR